MYAFTARQDGEVISSQPDGIQVKYKDGTVKGFQVGRRFGAAAGLTIPHDLVTDLKTGDKFSFGDPIVYNKGFFEKDILDPKQIVWKAGVNAKVVLFESTETLEDASSISEELAQRLKTKTTKVKTIVVNFDQVVRSMVNVNDIMKPDTPLCIVEDATTHGANLFDEETLNTLQLLSNQAPTAKVNGVLDRIEVYYHGDIDDMSDSLKKLTNQFNKSASVRSKAIGKENVSGSVASGMSIDGEPLALDTLAIKFYITGDVPAGVGDKGVFANQLKTVFSKVFANKMRTESGTIIDAVFGQKSVQDRIVTSVNTIGTTNTLLGVIGKRAVQIYKQGVK